MKTVWLLLAFLLPVGLAFAGDGSSTGDPTLASLRSIAWDGTFEITLADARAKPIPIRFVTAPDFDARGRLGYHFAVLGANDELATVIQALEPGDERGCTEDPALSSERFVELHGDGVPNVYHGTVWVSRIQRNPVSGECAPTEKGLPVQRFEIQPGSPRKLSIVIAPFTGLSIVYHFTEASPQPADWKAWLKAFNR